MSPLATYLLLTAVALAAVAVTLAPFVKAYWKARGARLVTCPENRQPVRVEIDAMDAAFSALLRPVDLQLRSCTRWPEKAGCGQECLVQIEKAPNGCRVRSVLAEWYQGKTCVLCGKPFGEMHTWDHKPVLMSLDRVTQEWADVAVEDLPEKLATCLPVCWDCHVVETLYRMHPELIVEREPHKPYWA